MSERDRRGRPALLTGVAMLGLVAGASGAKAEELAVADPRLNITEVEDVRHRATAIDFETAEEHARSAAPEVGMVLERFVDWVSVEDHPEIVIAQPGTPITSRDPVNVNGVGQMVLPTFNPAGAIVSLGTCTGSLINPRTVLFAAHCVNTRPATDFGTGGAPLAFGFNNANNTTQPGAPTGTSPRNNWLFGGTDRAPFTSSAAENFFTVNGLVYNPLSLEPAAAGFLYGDVAIASLDTPARNVPTWALLLSALTPPTTSTPANGTGYHVVVTGYGANGVGDLGATGAIDSRRRIAENWLGALTSINARDTAIFGGFTTNRPQNLYWIDFDDPRRGTAAASPFDFNIFRDNALPNEGTTSGGNSGGPLILDRTFDRQVVIGVLSGGSRFFVPQQPFSSYGTTSFYQPIYLYWDWIAANNPYRYVGAVAGNGNWEDPTRWVSLQDPNYFIIGPNGQLVNGVPTTAGEQNLGSSGQFGEICTQGNLRSALGVNRCINLATGVITDTTGGVGGPNVTATIGADFSNNYGIVSIDGSAAVEPSNAVTLTGSEETPFNTALVLPAPTIANGLPGATNFVPNNTPGNRLQGVLPRYFDVTLANAGTMTLSSNVTIDKLTVRGLAGLNIASNSQLTALNDVSLLGGMINVNGRLTSASDFFILSGMLQGSGTIVAPFVNSVAGTISPGGTGTTSTLSITGNLVLASGTQYLVDVIGTASDRIAVTGQANIGGQVVVGTGITDQVNGLGRQFTIVSATGGVTGAFTPLSLSPILRQSFTVQSNAVLMQINAASYNTVINSGDPVQVAYARLLDQNRANGALSSIYALDFASVDTIRSTFTRLAPVNEQAVRSLAAQSINTLQNFYDARLREANKDRAGGKVAITGRPLELAQMSLSPAMQPLGGAVMGAQEGAGETEMREANLPENVGLFLSGGFITGDAVSFPGYEIGREVDGRFLTSTTSYSGWYLAGGIEFYPGESTMIGLSGHVSSIDADVPLGQSVENETYAAALYMRHDFASGVVIDGQFAMGSAGFDTRRQVTFLTTQQTLESSSDDLLVSGALGLSYDLETSAGTISPGIEARYASIAFTRTQETGGTMALSFDRETYKSTQLRAGFDWEKKGKSAAFNARAQIVRELEQGSRVLGANFATGTGAGAGFALGAVDRTWGEIGISGTFGTGPVQISAGFDTTIARSDADARVIRGTATWRF